MSQTYRHDGDVKRQILVVDDEQINRAMLGMMLEERFEVLFAENGQEALKIAREYHRTLSLILLDLMMPVMHGFDVLRVLREESCLSKIPVIVMTAEGSAEVESLRLGAIDFIPKPYDHPDVILARIQRTIELSEDRQIIQSTERDHLTGLYNKEFFFRYADQFDQHHHELDMDALVIDIHHFHMLNERYGKSYCDQMLRRIGEHLRVIISPLGGILCRREADTFLIYCPHGLDYRQLPEELSNALFEEDACARIRFRVGVYASVDKSVDVEQRFDHAAIAANTVRSAYANAVGFYDSQLHERELYQEQLLDDFHTAVAQHQFHVYYQPKFDIRTDIPILTSAEALVRWIHPTFGFISPGVFIPLFEEHGLIRELDEYVWREAAWQIRDWKKRFHLTIPVSVNVSRIDMYDPRLLETFQSILEEYELTSSEYLLEITESAYTQDSEQIIQTVNALREKGFRIEMDDFGTGYSSLGMISRLPIDALKLDMTFIRNAFNERKDIRMLQLIIDIADYLKVPVIAEGVETEEQMLALKAMGCDIVQGYYFSKPVPAREYEKFIEKRQQIQENQTANADDSTVLPRSAYESAAHALSGGFESIFYVDTETGHYVEFGGKGLYQDLQIQRSGLDYFGETQKNLLRIAYPDDLARVSLSMQKETLLSELRSQKVFSMTYRLVIDGKPMYYNLKAVRVMGKNDHNIVIGVSNVDAQMRTAMQGEDAPGRAEELYNIASALSADYECVFYVDMTSGVYGAFTSRRNDQKLGMESEGKDFFLDAQRHILTQTHPADQAEVRRMLSRDALIKALPVDGQVRGDFRVMVDGTPVRYSMRITLTGKADTPHLVVGLSRMERSDRMERRTGFQSTFARIAQALAQDYITVFDLNVTTESYAEYATRAGGELNLVASGKAFFDMAKERIARSVESTERAMVQQAFERETFLQTLREQRMIMLSYHRVQDGIKSYVTAKVMQTADEPEHIVIGISNAEAQRKREEELSATRAERLTYAQIAQTLAQDYLAIYYVDLASDQFVKYTFSTRDQALEQGMAGDDFFHYMRTHLPEMVFPEDVGKALRVFDRQTLTQILDKEPVYTMSVRFLLSGVPTYMSVKLMRHNQEDNHHMIVGISNVDAQIKREKEYAVAQELALKDPLTSVKNKRAYQKTEEKMNQEIQNGSIGSFAIVFCDVNGLKAVNDTLGHAAGDQFIKDACMEICGIFKHSPVFRMGGDEFAVILRGADYDNREELCAQLSRNNAFFRDSGGIVIANGISVYDPKRDTDVASVFERADTAMYANKKVLKGER